MRNGLSPPPRAIFFSALSKYFKHFECHYIIPCHHYSMDAYILSNIRLDAAFDIGYRASVNFWLSFSHLPVLPIFCKTNRSTTDKTHWTRLSFNDLRYRLHNSRQIHGFIFFPHRSLLDGKIVVSCHKNISVIPHPANCSTSEGSVL
jgi:hypothetical protein